MQQIDIATVLARFDDTYDELTHEEKFFGIEFIDRNGNIHTVEVRKNAKDPKLKRESKDMRAKSVFSLQRNGLIQLRERNSDHPITPKACMIFRFRDFKSNVWLNVFH